MINRQAIPIIALLLFTAIAPALAATCHGAKNCRACRTCEYCKYCSVRGHTCGVCAGHKAVKKHPPRKHKNSS